MHNSAVVEMNKYDMLNEEDTKTYDMLNLKIQDGIPDPHPFLDISWRDLIPQSNHKLQD
jgi:hypothetical protein